MVADGVLVIGAGGHASVCIDVLQSGGERVLGCLSDDGVARRPLPVAVLGLDSEVDRFIADGLDRLFVAVGDNRARLLLIERCLASGAQVINAVSPHAVVSPSVTFGVGVVLMAGAVVNAGASLGDGLIVNTNASVDHDADLGRGVHVCPGCAVAGDVAVGEGALLGVGSSVAPGRKVGAWATIGAGAAVVHDIPDGVVAVGVPARSVVA